MTASSFVYGDNKSSLQSVTCINVQFCNVRPGKCVRPGNAGPERAHSWRLAGNKSPKCHLLSSWFEKKPTRGISSKVFNWPEMKLAKSKNSGQLLKH